MHSHGAFIVAAKRFLPTTSIFVEERGASAPVEILTEKATE
jgi:hypothetical protein